MREERPRLKRKKKAGGEKRVPKLKRAPLSPLRTFRLEREARALWIQERLQELFPDPLPALHFSDPFTLLIAVLLSAQCTDKRVNLVTPGLFALASTPEEMAKLPVEAIEEAIRSTGFFHVKARNIKALSEILVQKYRGRVPDSLEALEELPGVGHKTASVMMIHAFGKRAFPVDTHIHRLAVRWGLSPGKNVETTERDLKPLFAEESWALLHLQIILFGRTYCQARGHREEICPICRDLYHPL